MNRFAADSRAWLTAGGVAALLILLVGWLLLIGPERSATGGLVDQAAQSQQQSALLRTKVATLTAKSDKSAQYAARLQDAEAALPYDSGLPTFTRQLNAQARAAGVSLSALVVSGVTAATSATPASGAPPSGAPSGSATTTPATPGAVTTVGGLFSLRVTVTTKGSMVDQLAFLRAIRSGPRRALVNGTQFGSAGTSKTASVERSSSVTTDLTVFSAPQSLQAIRAVHQLAAGLAG